MLKYLVFSVTYLESATDPVSKLSTDPAPLACNKYMSIGFHLIEENVVADSHANNYNLVF